MINVFHANHLESYDYCIIICFFHLKRYQEEVIRNNPCNIYLNLLSPENCPVLDLAKYVLEYPNFIKDDLSFPPGDY